MSFREGIPRTGGIRPEAWLHEAGRDGDGRKVGVERTHPKNLPELKMGGDGAFPLSGR
jgi:hypothetical protein